MNPKENKVDLVINELFLKKVPSFCEDNKKICFAAFLTGSFLRKTHDSMLPNVNVYFISIENKSAELRLALSIFFTDVRKQFRRHGFDFEIDCHPFTIVSRAHGDCEFPRVLITTKVFDFTFSNKRLSLPPTIGLGWLQSFEVLWGNVDLPEILSIPIKTDIEWFQAIHEALTRYRGILDHLPWALPWQHEPRLLAFESLRYAEEALKDALTVALTEEELKNNLQFQLYSLWNAGTDEFLKNRYGEEGYWMNQAVLSLKKRMKDAEPISEAEAVEAWNMALKVWDIVWNQFVERVRKERPDDVSWLTRCNSFI